VTNGLRKETGRGFGPKSAVLDNQETAVLIDDNNGDLQNIRCIRLVSVLKGGVEPPNHKEGASSMKPFIRNEN